MSLFAISSVVKRNNVELNLLVLWICNVNQSLNSLLVNYMNCVLIYPSESRSLIMKAFQLAAHEAVWNLANDCFLLVNFSDDKVCVWVVNIDVLGEVWREDEWILSNIHYVYGDIAESVSWFPNDSAIFTLFSWIDELSLVSKSQI